MTITDKQLSQVLGEVFSNVTLNAPSDDSFNSIASLSKNPTKAEKARLRLCITVAQASLLLWYIGRVSGSSSAAIISEYGDALRKELKRSNLTVLLEEYVVLKDERVAFVSGHPDQYRLALLPDGQHNINISDLIFGLIAIRRDDFSVSFKADFDREDGLFPYWETSRLIVKGFLGKESSTEASEALLTAMIGAYLANLLVGVHKTLVGDRQ